MRFTEREEKVLSDIRLWEEQYLEYEASDIERTYQQWLHRGFEQLGDKKQKKVLSLIDTTLFYLQSIIQQSRFQEEARKRLIEQAQVFDHSIEYIEDMQRLSIEQLTYLANQQVAKQRLYSLGQGGISGMGGFMLLGIDLPAMLVINLRSVQLIALTYGYDVKHPAEMMIALKLFHAASLPKHLRRFAWDDLLQEVRKEQFDQWFYDGSEEVTDRTWLMQPMRQILKVVAISAVKKKAIQGLPLIGIAIGASINYQFTKQITEAAHYFYQKRFLLDK